MPNFVSVAPSVAELACGEKPRSQAITHSPILTDVPGTEAFGLEKYSHRTQSSTAYGVVTSE